MVCSCFSDVRTFFACIFIACICLTGALPAAAGPVELIDNRTPWRVWLVQGMNLIREGGVLKIAEQRQAAPFDPAHFDPQRHRFSPLPPPRWRETDFDDYAWARYHSDDLADYLGDYGAVVDGRSWPALLCLRTAFAIDDPAKVADLKLSVTFIGGVVAYVNGREVGRAFMPSGSLEPLTCADDYPIEAYTAEDNRTPLPVVDYGSKRATPPDPKQLARYQKRIRKAAFDVPAAALVRGRNILAIELHRSAVAGPVANRAWSHAGFHAAALTSAAGTGVVPYAQLLTGTRLWNAQPVEQIADKPPAGSLIKRSWFWTMYWARGLPVKGVQFANPLDPLRPLRIAAPRNGTGSGQVVVSDIDGVRSLEASLSDLKGPGNSVIPAGAVNIRYAVRHDAVHYCDALMPAPPRDARTVPVWLIVNVPRDASAGWYTSTLTIRANGRDFALPVQLLVTGFALPDAKDLQPQIGMTHSPETIAMHYRVEPWSERHWQLMDRSFELMGQVGNDVVHVPVILGGAVPTAKGAPRPTTVPAQIRMPLVRWVKNGDSVQPDFSLLEKYLDRYTRYCAPPQALSFYIWDAACVSEVADAYEGRRIASRIFTPKAPLCVVLWDPQKNQGSEMKIPAITDEGAEAFYRPLLDGILRLVKNRGWSERIIMFSLGGDFRPGEQTAQIMRRWAPYARWNLLSHFSGDPAPSNGRMIATGNLEVGLKEWPAGGCLPVSALAQRVLNPPDFLELPTIRWQHQEYSPPMLFRTLAMQWGCITRIGLDFWLAKSRGPRSTSFFSHIESLTVPGPDGAIPTVRFQMFREGVQDAHLRAAIIIAGIKLPADQQQSWRSLLDELLTRMAWSSAYLSQHELSWDWPAYAARVQETAATLYGTGSDARWDAPPP